MSIISAGNTVTTAMVQTADTSGNLTFVTTGGVLYANSSAGGFAMPSGTTAQRPASAVNGMMWYNTDINDIELYVGGAWVATNYTAKPVNTVAPVVSGSAQVNQTVSVSTGTWTNSPTSYAYQWLANSSAITNATSNTYTLTLSQVGANISCNVTAINIAGNATATSNSIGPVVATYDVSFLLAAGGGGAGGSAGIGGAGGGGGGGGVLSNSTTVTIGTSYTITVGAGGGGRSYSTAPTQGGNSSAFSLTAIGGGHGESGNGGSGGGDSGGGGNGVYLPGGSGTAGPPRQGYDGGQGWHQDGNGAGGGGGGSGQAGFGGVAPRAGGNGGNGVSSTITGSAVYYAAGGGGGSYGGSGGSGGLGGGGQGYGASSGQAGTVNTGSGGGGGGQGNGDGGGAGGSGVVILSMLTSAFSNSYTGSNVVVTTSGSNTIVKFNSSGTYTA